MTGFDARKFERDLKKAVEKAANEGMRKVGSDLQRTFDAVYRTHSGKPVTEVRTALSAALRRAAFTPSAGQLRSWSEAISSGTYIKVDVQPARFRCFKLLSY